MSIGDSRAAYLNGILDRAHATPYAGGAALSTDEYLNNILDRAHATPFVGGAVTLPPSATSGTFHPAGCRVTAVRRRRVASKPPASRGPSPNRQLTEPRAADAWTSPALRCFGRTERARSVRSPSTGSATYEVVSSARRSVSRVLSCPACAGPGMAIHLGPPVARRLLRPTRGLGSAPLPRQRSPARGLRPPIWPCSGWSLPVSLRSSACAAVRHRHCGTGPRLTAGGRYPPPCAAELGLSSRRATGLPIADA